MQNLPLQCKHLSPPTPVSRAPWHHHHTHTHHFKASCWESSKIPRQLLPTYFSAFFLLLMSTLPPMPRQLQVPRRLKKRSLSGRCRVLGKHSGKVFQISLTTPSTLRASCGPYTRKSSNAEALSSRRTCRFFLWGLGNSITTWRGAA